MIEYTGRTVICSVVFTDIVGYSKESDALQLEIKARLNELIAQAVDPISTNERVILDTGDGAAICFLGDPEDALYVATAVNDAVIREGGRTAHTLRTGINLGPIKIVTDVNGQPTVVGDGINVAQRVMSFAGDGEILVSRSYYEVVVRLQQDNDKLFRYLGTKKDKHVREHQIYAFGLQFAEAPPGRAAPASDPLPYAAGVAPEAGSNVTIDVSAQVVAEDTISSVERQLTTRIGPLAKVIVKRAADSSRSEEDFFDTVSRAIPDQADRASFLADVSESGDSSGRRSGSSGADRSTGPTTPMSRNVPEAPPQPQVAREDLTPEQLSKAEQVLATYIGPLSGILVKQAAAEATDLRDLYIRLAENISKEADRERFLAGIGG